MCDIIVEIRHGAGDLGLDVRHLVYLGWKRKLPVWRYDRRTGAVERKIRLIRIANDHAYPRCILINLPEETLIMYGFVIPAKAGIQGIQMLMDTRPRGHDDNSEIPRGNGDDRLALKQRWLFCLFTISG